MSKASDLIERLERETGQRIDANGGDNLAMAGLFGALARELGQSQRGERETEQALAMLLQMGLSPDDIRRL